MRVNYNNQRIHLCNFVKRYITQNQSKSKQNLNIKMLRYIITNKAELLVILLLF